MVIPGELLLQRDPEFMLTMVAMDSGLVHWRSFGAVADAPE